MMTARHEVYIRTINTLSRGKDLREPCTLQYFHVSFWLPSTQVSLDNTLQTSKYNIQIYITILCNFKINIYNYEKVFCYTIADKSAALM